MKKTKPRKNASQERSKLTVNSILQATTQLLTESGLKKLTTSRIVERAGVSVGSLYQYFPSKESILSVILEKQFNKNVDDFISKLESLDKENLSFKEAIDELARFLIADFKVHSKIHKELLFSMLSLNNLKFTLKNDERVTQAIKQYIGNWKNEVREDIDYERAVFLFQYAFKGIKFGLVFASKEDYSEKIHQDLSLLIYQYFKK